jgi:heterotetrameric sarcosine oxidase gamma subunit
MAEPRLQPRSALAELLVGTGPSSAHATSPGLRVVDRDGLQLATVLVRAGQEGALRAVMRQRFGLDLPNGARRTVAGPLSAIGTGPGAWLVVAEAADDLAGSLARALDGMASVADQSSGYAVLRLAGPALREVLEKGIALDLHEAAFGPDAAAVTMVAHIGIILWRADEGRGGSSIEVAVPRSTFGSFWSWLAGSAALTGFVVEPAVGEAASGPRG